MKTLRGTFTAIVTPLTPEGEIDVAALEGLVGWQFASRADGIVPCGTTGEGATLTPDEHALVVRCVAETVAGRIPVVGLCRTTSSGVIMFGVRGNTSSR